MSRQIDTSEGYEHLDQDELKYLHDRGLLPESERHLYTGDGATVSAPARASQPEPEVDPDPDSEDDDDYTTWSKASLQEELKGRGIKFASKANREDLIGLLEANDAETTED